MPNNFHNGNAAITIGGMAVAAVSQICQADPNMVGLAGALSFVAGMGGNQAHAWLSSHFQGLPPKSEEIFRNHHIRGLLEKSVATVLGVVEIDSEDDAALQQARATLPKAVADAVEDSNSLLATLGDYDLPTILAAFAANEGKVTLLTPEIWLALVQANTELWEEHKILIAQTLHKRLAEALWNHVKYANEKDPQAFAAVELHYLSRILNAVEGRANAPDTSALKTHMEMLVERLDAKQTQWFTEDMKAHAETHRLGNSFLELFKIHAERLEEIYKAVLEPLRPAAPHQIDGPPPYFTGRENELSELRDGMARSSVAVSGISGMGGMGKTALALQLAAELKTRYCDADLYLDLRGVESPPLSVTAALQILIRPFVSPTEQLSNNVAELRGRYLSALREQRAVVLLDNAKDAAQVAPLLPPASCAVIVTSRQFFTRPGLKPIRLGKLPPDKACALLLEIESRIGNCAAEMARLLDYLPLGLRLAASAVAHSINLTPQAYLARLADAHTRLGLTDDTPLEGPRSIEATIQLSYDLLDATQQARWLRLAVFAAPFDDAAAAALWEMDAEGANTALTGLLDFSMVEFDAATARYRLHDLARDFAWARLNENGTESYAAQLRHAVHYLWTIAEAQRLFLEGDEAFLQGLKLFDSERVNIEAGQSWAQLHAANNTDAARLCMEYPNVGAQVLLLRLTARERIGWLDAARAATQQLQNSEMEEATLGNLGKAHQDLDDLQHAIELFKQQLDTARKIGNRRGECDALANRGAAYKNWYKPRCAIILCKEALKIAREIPCRRGEGFALGVLGSCYKNLGESHRAIEFYEQQLIILSEIGDRKSEGYTLGNIGTAYRALGKSHLAIEFFTQQRDIARKIGDRWSEGYVLGNIGLAYADLGQTRRALEFYKKSIAIERKIGKLHGEGYSLLHASVALDELGDRTQAVVYAEAALKIFEQIKNPGADKARQKLAEWRSETEGRGDNAAVL